MKNLIRRILKADLIIIVIPVFLTIIGLLIIFFNPSLKNPFAFQKQLTFLLIGLALMVLLSFIDWRAFQENSYLLLAIYLASNFLLIGLFFFAPEIRGVKNWYRFLGVSIDPVEFICLSLMLLLAKYFSSRHVEMYRVRHIFFSGLYAFLPSIILFFQSNMGAILVVVSLWLGILFVSGIRLRHFLVICLLGLITVVAAWSFFLKDYQRERINSFLFPQNEPLGIGWSQSQAKIAIGSGGIFGRGLGKATQTKYGFLSEPHTDFIFAAAAETFGLAGVAFIFILFLVFFARTISIAIGLPTNFCRLFVLGFLVHLASQIIINAGMNLNLLPVIGISFPFFSYGGSGLIVNFAVLGIVQGMIVDNRL